MDFCNRTGAKKNMAKEKPEVIVDRLKNPAPRGVQG
jgi:hypothetical protein